MKEPEALKEWEHVLGKYHINKIRHQEKAKVHMANGNSGHFSGLLGSSNIFPNPQNFHVETPPWSNFDHFDPIKNLKSIEVLRAWVQNYINTNIRV